MPDSQSFEIADMGKLQWDTDLAALDNGDFVAVWEQVVDTGTMQFDVYFRRLDANGKPRGNPVKVNASPGASALPRVAALSNGGFVVGWRTVEGEQSRIFLQRYDADSNTVGDPVSLLQDSAGFDVTGLYDTDTGSFVLAQGPSRFCIVDGTTGTAGEPVTLYGDDGAGQSLTVESLGESGFVAVWTVDKYIDGGMYEIYARRFDPKGTPVDAKEISVNDTSRNDQTEPSVTALTGGGYVVAWNSNQDAVASRNQLSDVFFRVFSSTDGAPVTGEICIDNDGKHLSDGVCAAALTNNCLAMAWQQRSLAPGQYGPQVPSKAIYIQRYNDRRRALGFADLVTSSMPAEDETYWDPMLVGLKKGGYVVTWVTSKGTGDSQQLTLSGRIYPQIPATANDDADQDDMPVPPSGSGEFSPQRHY